MRQDLQHRAEVLAESLAQNVEPYFGKGSKQLQRIVEQFGNREHLAGVVIYDRPGSTLAATPGLTRVLTKEPSAATRAQTEDRGTSEFVHFGTQILNIYALPLHAN